MQKRIDYYKKLDGDAKENLEESEKAKQEYTQKLADADQEIAEKLSLIHILKILGTAPEVIDLAEDRDLFREMMEKLEIPMPESGMATTVEEAIGIANGIGYPVMVRPSYVLGGRGMEVVYDDESMTEYMKAAVGVAPDRPILLLSLIHI